MAALTWLRRGLGALALLVLSLLLYVAATLWDLGDRLYWWSREVQLHPLRGWRFMVGVSIAPRPTEFPDSLFHGYRHIYLGRWFLEWPD